MTIKQILQRVSKAREQDAVETAREILQDVPGEVTTYRPTARWQSILSSIGLGEMENKVACVTYYAVDESIFAKVKTALKGRYKAVADIQADELGFRRIFICGDAADKEPTLLICCNYYQSDRQATKAQFAESQSNNATAEVSNAADEVDLDPFE